MTLQAPCGYPNPPAHPPYENVGRWRGRPPYNPISRFDESNIHLPCSPMSAIKILSSDSELVYESLQKTCQSYWTKWRSSFHDFSEGLFGVV